MSEVSTVEQRQVEPRDTASLSRQVDELIPILAHGFTQEIEDRGLRGKVQLHAVAGDAWSVGTSQDNKYGVPNVITYPQDYLATTDLRVINARLRHEIGNLNYPFERQLTELSAWAREQGIPPQIVTTLAQAIHGPSVDYLEMRSSHSSAPEENFRAMYETEVDVKRIAQTIGDRSPYRQALDITYLEGLSAAGLVSREVVDTAIQGATPEVRAVITPEMEEQIAEAVKSSNSRRKAAMIRDSLFPQLSQLAALDAEAAQDDSPELDPMDQVRERLRELSGEQTDTAPNAEDNPSSPSNPDLEAQMQQVREQLQKLKEQMQRKSDQQRDGDSQQQNRSERQRGQQAQQGEMSPEERHEREQAKDLLEESLRERLQDIKDQMQQQGQQPSAEKQEATPQSMQEIGDQAQQMKEQLEQQLQDAQQVSQDQQMADQLEKLKEQLQQLEEVAKQLSEDQQAQEAEDEEPMTYNIKEYGIDESKLSDEQLELLGKVRTYAQKTSKTYRTAMRVLMTAYQQHNPNFTDEMIQKMKDRGYDLPDFSIYSPEAAQEFLSQQAELGIDSVQEGDFLVNFNLPRPIGRMWYRGGNGSRSIPVPEGAIEWGEFYRRTMPVIWNAADRAAMTEKLYLDRLNQFGQHDAKKYYYLYEAANIPAMDDQADQANQQADQNDPQQSQDSQSGEDGQQPQEGQEAQPGGQQQGEQGQQGQEGTQQSGSQEGGQQGGQSGQPGQNGQQSSQEGGSPGKDQGSQQGEGQSGSMQGGQPGQGEMGGMSPQEIENLMQQVQQMLNEAKGQGGQQGSQPGQEGMSPMQQELQQLMNQLQKLQQQAGQNGQSGSQNGQQASEGQQSEDNGESGAEGQNAEGGQPGKDQNGQQGQSEPGGEPSSQSQPGGQGQQEGRGVQFSKRNKRLLDQLEELNSQIASKFAEQGENDEFGIRKAEEEIASRLVEQQRERIHATQSAQIAELERIKDEQRGQLVNYYKELSGLEGEALEVYTDYMAEMEEFVDEASAFFVERFHLNEEYQMTRDQLHGSRLQKGWQENILGSKDGKPLLRPNSFERRLNPDKPTFCWSIVLDNTGSTAGGVIESEKKLAVGLIELTKRLNIPFEILVFTEGGYRFLKTFDQEIAGEDLAKVVLLDASIGNQNDELILNAACNSLQNYSDQFDHPYNFVFFLTDGLVCEGSIPGVISNYKRDMVVTGIGLQNGAATIREHFGKNALSVPDVDQLSQRFFDKIEDQIEETFD